MGTMPSGKTRAHKPTRAKDPDLVTLGLRVRELRQRLGKSQETLAHDAGLHWTYVGQIERGLRNVTYKNLRRLARGLQVDIAELFRPPGTATSAPPVAPVSSDD
jgi:transcriptional regulator with XRE-family HTH domain